MNTLINSIIHIYNNDFDASADKIKKQIKYYFGILSNDKKYCTVILYYILNIILIHMQTEQ